MSYLLPANGTVELKSPVGAQGIITFQSASLDLTRGPKDDNTSVSIKNGKEILLAISVRCFQSAIVFNNMTADGKWGVEVWKELSGAFVGPNYNIMIIDHDDRYQILFSNRTIHYFTKRSPNKVDTVQYSLLEQQKTSAYALALVVTTCDSIGELVGEHPLVSSERRPLVSQTGPNDYVNLATTMAAYRQRIGLVALPGEKMTNRLGIEYAEHAYIGDAITLTLEDGNTVVANKYLFAMPNGLHLTYGQINGLGGDFYGTKNPISDGTSQEAQSERFSAAYRKLAYKSSRQPNEAVEILRVLRAEVDAVNHALQDGEDPSKAYSTLPDTTAKFERITLGRPSDEPGYLGLAAINWDHFGADARTSYNAGHLTALRVAAEGDLEGAYAMNAFADHFLEGSFSAGHLRTPRRLLHSPTNRSADLCAKYMHDEDNAIGLSVKDPANNEWTVYGDKRALDPVNKDNLGRCLAAVQASADEIYAAWKIEQVPDVKDFKVWTIACTLESAADESQVLKHLFTFDNERRDVITNRRTFSPNKSWWAHTTAALCWNSGWWKYPITLDGPDKVVDERESTPSSEQGTESWDLC